MIPPDYRSYRSTQQTCDEFVVEAFWRQGAGRLWIADNTTGGRSYSLFLVSPAQILKQIQPGLAGTHEIGVAIAIHVYRGHL